MITFAKGVTSGYFPLGGVSSRAALNSCAGPTIANAMFGHGYTYTSHPIGCAVALKNLDLLEGGMLDHARKVAPYFQARLKTLEELPLVGEVRGAGLMACIECVADRESNDPLQLDKDVGKRIDPHCHELGLLVRPLINMCVMSPPLIITERADRRHGRASCARAFRARWTISGLKGVWQGMRSGRIGSSRLGAKLDSK